MSSPIIAGKRAGKKKTPAEVELDAAATEVARILGSIYEVEVQQSAVRARLSTLKKAKAAATRRLKTAEKAVFKGTLEVDSGTQLRLETVELGNKLIAALEVVDAYFSGKPFVRGGPTEREHREAMALLHAHDVAIDLIWFGEQMEACYAARCTTEDCAHFNRTLFNAGGYCRQCETTHPFTYSGGPWDSGQHENAENPAALIRRIEHRSSLGKAVVETRKRISDKFKLGLQV